MDEIMNRIGEVYEPFKVHFLHKPVRPLAPDEVLVKVRASAICGSDLHIARGLHPSAPLPVTIGHEFSGDVVAIGSEVTKAHLGERTGSTATASISALPTATATVPWRTMSWSRNRMSTSCPTT